METFIILVIAVVLFVIGYNKITKPKREQKRQQELVEKYTNKPVICIVKTGRSRVSATPKASYKFKDIFEAAEALGIEPYGVMIRAKTNLTYLVPETIKKPELVVYDFIWAD